MAKKDRKPVSYGRGGSMGSSYSYDDKGRGNSKHYFEIFEKLFEASGHSAEWLLGDFELGTEPPERHGYIRGYAYFEEGLQAEFIFNHWEAATMRYTIHDWATNAFEDPPGNDGRTRRLIVDKCGVETWQKFQERAAKIVNKVQERRAEERQARQEEWAAKQAALKAERIERQEEQNRQISQRVEKVAGSLRSDFHSAFETKEAHGREEGDFIDDVVALYMTGRGYGEEQDKATGVKLQITLSLDTSNSMIYNVDADGNKLYMPASDTFRDLWLTLEEMEEEHHGDLFIGAFTFCGNTSEYKNRRRYDRHGKLAKCLSVKSDWRGNITGDEPIRARDEELSLGPVEKFRTPEAVQFTGYDTWYYPLFERIEQWENKFSDPGAIKLDLVITDAALEHPTDISKSDEVQERRDGTLHTVMLNLLPKEEWSHSDLPLRCIQYPADADNLSGMLRLLISEFVNVHV